MRGGGKSQMGVPLHGLLTNTRLRGTLRVGFLLPHDALPFSLLFLSPFLSKRVRIIRVRVSVCEPASSPGVARARCAEMPKPFLVVRLSSETERECRQATCTSESDQVAPALQEPQKRMQFVEAFV